MLYTDGLIEDRNQAIDAGLQRLRRVLARPGRAPEETCEAVLDAMLPTRPSDDVVLPVARTRALDADLAAQWDLPADPAVVSRARTAATEQLAAWGLDDLAFATALVVSELVTSAMRHATGPGAATAAARPGPDPRGVRRRRHLAPAAPCPHRGRGRPLPVPRRPAHRPPGPRHTADGKAIRTEQRLPARTRPV